MIMVEMSQLGLLKIYVHQGLTGAREIVRARSKERGFRCQLQREERHLHSHVHGSFGQDVSAG